MSDWRAYRPAIWLAMFGIALILLVSPIYLGAVLLGAAIGVTARIARIRRRRPRPARPQRRSRPS